MSEQIVEKTIVPQTAEHFVPIRTVTRGPGHYFFGYYDKQQWNNIDRYLLGMRSTFADRPVSTEDVLEIGMIDLHNDDRWIGLAKTRAWCWQQGCMLQWLPGSDCEIIFNDRIDDRFVAVIMDVKTGLKRTLPRAIYTLSNDGRWALSLNFSRLAITRPGYGYVRGPSLPVNLPSLAEDGIWLMDLETERCELIISIDQIARHCPEATMASEVHWFNHLLFSPDGSRLIFLHRWALGEKQWQTRLYTADRDGSQLRCAPVTGASHFIWYDNRRILVWATESANGKARYCLIDDQSCEIETLGEDILTQDGHMTISPDGCWVLTDEYPDDHGYRPLILYRIDTGCRKELGRFFSPMTESVELRCDLHPRWNCKGTQISIDSIHEGYRRIYVLDHYCPVRS